jgi:hypothetical protein
MLTAEAMFLLLLLPRLSNLGRRRFTAGDINTNHDKWTSRGDDNAVREQEGEKREEDKEEILGPRDKGAVPS